ncbi:alpha/beta hydrolase [Streptomyces uncialis]|uniref:alpha/beta hydrolase n=1 Tax=Streptomyces uncialis TaxID=1048205 RepID=UPI00224FF8EB|nr:alpha/beta hydrolase [Streptomyces uncialis]MCX4660878.1 alpha/beta hydrolase [Streptomyces uncialis]
MLLRRRATSKIALGVAAVLAPTLLSTTAAATPTADPGSSVNVAATASAAMSSLTWRGCDADVPATVECTTLDVPLDHRKPSGKKLELSLSRIKAADPAKRRGVLLFNPGGPSGSGLFYPLALSGLLPQSVKDRYDLIGFDPRGVGASSPLACGTTTADERLTYRPYKDATFAKDVAWARDIAQGCRNLNKDTLPHISTRNTARDMDIIRAALGERKISYFGLSYGTYLGSVYTQLFPQRADRFVLDSAVDPKRVWRSMSQSWAVQAETAFDRWTAWTARNSARYGFGDTSAEVERLFWDIVARADREPLDLGGTVFDGAEVREYIRWQITHPSVAADTLGLLRDAAAGKPVPTFPTFVPTDNELASYLAIMCGDARWPTDPAVYQADSRRDSVRYPLYGDSVSNVFPCAFWDRPLEAATKVDNKVPALIVQNEWDSQTPLVAAQGLRRALKGSRLVTVDEGQGHGVYSLGISTCADEHTTTYLITGRLPARDVTCAADPQAAADSRSASPNPAPVPARLPFSGR